MKKYLLLLCITALLFSCADNTALKKNIVGKWECYQTLADDGENLQAKLTSHPIFVFTETHVTCKEFLGDLPAEYNIKGGRLFIKGEKGSKKIKINQNIMTWDESSFAVSIHYEFKRIN
jgi:hypothetical protein